MVKQRPTTDFGHLLRHHRLAAGLSQEDLAERAGLSIRGISDLERGQRSAPRLETVRLLADGLGLAATDRAALIAAARPELSPADHDQPAPPSSAVTVRGTVAFLFTDLEDSTRLWQAHPAAMQRAYARHDALLRGAIAAHGGVAYKVVGDAVQAAFPTVPAAVAAALEAQRVLVAEAWDLAGLPETLRVRMALHAGAIDPDPSGDYRSPVLNRLGRLLGAGHGGQILLSQAAGELARDHLPEGAFLRELGEQRLRDLDRPERVWQLVHPDLPDRFPPLATLTGTPNNLPAQPTRLVGREREVAEVVSVLRRPEARLVTLTGPGGVGKTRLAVASAGEVAEDFADGVCWVELAPVREPGLVAAAVARSLGIREAGGAPLAETLRATLASRKLLLVLDNLEQVLPAAIEVASWLAAAPGLKVLATSRERLHLRGEREIPIEPLALPVPPQPGAPTPPLEGLAGVAAIRLFVERAEEARHGFALRAENAGAVAEIVRRLDGLPLAIELAAARVRMLAPRDLLSQLARRLPTLTDGPCDLPARQQTLRDAIGWSHDLLTSEEQVLFRRLAVFAGGCTLEAAEAVAEGLGAKGQGLAGGGSASPQPPAPSPPSVLDVIGSLVGRSLVRQVDEADEGTRFSMLETVREFAGEQLEMSGEADEAARAHADFFLALAEAAEPHLKGPEQSLWLTRLELEHDNLRAALAWTLARGEDEIGLRLAANLAQFWYTHSHLTEGRAWLDRVLAKDGGPRSARATALFGAAALARAQADHVRAATLADESIALSRTLADTTALSRSLYVRGAIAQAQGDADAAAAHLEEGLALARDLDNPARMASFLNVLSDVASARGDAPRAVALLEEALAMKRAAGDASGAAVCLNNLGVLFLEQGDLDRAERNFGEGLALCRALGDRAGIALGLNNQGAVARGRGDVSRALPLVIEALALFVEVGDRSGIAYCLEGLADVAAKQGAHRRAARLYGAADALREQICEPLPREQRAGYEASHELVRGAIGPPAFKDAWDAGRALSPEAAVAEARSLVEDARSPATADAVSLPSQKAT
jgi:predicted ATPase/class 3 adenylate cyclase